MGLFSSIKDELHNAYQVIAREQGTGAYPIWRHPTEDFRNGSILQVNEDDVALLLDNGKLVESFSGGRYTLTTSNYPFLDRLRASFSGGENSYKYTVFFINKKPMTNLRWGTQTPIPVEMHMPPFLPGGDFINVPVELQAQANYTVSIQDPKLFLSKDSQGTAIRWDQPRTKEEVNKEVIRPQLDAFVKSNIAAVIESVENGIFGVQKFLPDIAKKLETILDDGFRKFGMLLENFYLTTLNVLETDEFKDYKKRRASFGLHQMEMAEKALGEMQQINIQGEHWQRIQARDIMRDMVNNPGAGGIAATGAGLGMGMVAGGVMGNMAAAMFSPMQAPSQQQPPSFPSGPSRFAPKTSPQQTATPASASAPQAVCPHCGEIAGSGKFCGNCGQPLPQSATCSGCGANVPAGFKFCPNCGTKVC